MASRPSLPELRSDAAVPRFLWDRTVTAGELRQILADGQHPERLPLLGALLREARPDEVWDWVSPREVQAALPAVQPFLGRRREFWPWLIDGWVRLGLL